jgi:undecaprenyl-diphosphatase
MRFSFLLSLPAIIGATILQLKDIASATAEGQVTLGDYGIGFVVAFISGMVAIKLLYLVVKQRRLHYFGYYCWLTGIITLTINLLG